VIPKTLGLVIVDEEQRFGVAQKELLRALRLEVTCWRCRRRRSRGTLHMSLSGLRDISVIETPPEGRRPIRTHVGEYDEEQIKTRSSASTGEAGQSFYLHNRSRRSKEAATKIRELCPGLRIEVAHGQMRERSSRRR
jgi:transcription-repair coupling factor (superfamily II helicase)